MAALAAGRNLLDCSGASWEALAHCLTDLGWAPARGYVLRLDGLGSWGDRGAGSIGREALPRVIAG